jgi:Tfp pilus assembly protein PilX
MKKILAGDGGLILFVMLGMMLVMLSLAAASLFFTSIHARATGNLKAGTAAVHIADAGINHAVNYLSNASNYSAIYAASSGTQVVSNGSFGGGSYVVTQQGTASSPSRIKIRSVGTGTNGSSAQIEAWLQNIPSGLTCGICSQGNITLGTGAAIDSYDSSLGAYGGTNVGTNGDIATNANITLATGVAVHGDATTGGTGNISLGTGASISGNATAGGTVSLGTGAIVNGTTTNGTPSPITMPSVSACGPPYSNGTGITGGSYNSTTGQWTVGVGAKGALAAGTYCFSSISLSTGANLTVSGATIVNLTANSDLSTGSLVNSTGDPANLTIQSSYSSSSNGISFNTGAGVKATIICPSCVVTFSTGGHLYGQVIAGTLNNSTGAKVHYDTHLHSGGSGGSGIKIYGWVQTF